MACIQKPDPVNNGFTNTYQSGDGVNLFTADGDGVASDGHPLVNGGKEQQIAL